ncbi:MAG TPA: hypothetical protein VGS10_04490 [Terracidiphilus sp.]|nr:hypothetical protein [Terracidiphilus sp.]
MLRDFLNSLEPDQDSLLSAISEHITGEMLAEIAKADYGLDQEKHLAPLRLLRDEGIFVAPMHWYPCEVLELVSSATYGSCEPDQVRCNWISAFANAALIRAMQQPWNYSGGACLNSMLIHLLDSLGELPVDFAPDAIRLIAWLMLNSDLDGMDEQPIYCGVALLWLVLHGGASALDQDLICLAEWIVRREEEIHKSRHWAFDRWLLGISHDPPPSPWEHLGEQLAIVDLSSRSEQLREWVKLIGSELAGK